MSSYRMTKEGREVVDAVVQRAMAGELLEDIAASYGVEVGTLQVLLAVDALGGEIEAED